MARLKILVFVDWYLPGYRAGGPIRSVANIIAHLKDELEFSVVTADTDYCETKPYENIKSNEWNLLKDGTRVFYFSKDKLNYHNIRQLIFSENPDIIYLNSFFSYSFTIIPLLIFLLNFKLQASGFKLILAPRGMLASGALSIKSFKKRAYLFLFRFSGMVKRITFHASSEAEKTDIERELGRHLKMVVAPNLPPKISANHLPARAKSKGELRLINIARVSPEKNLSFALEILKEIKGNIVFDFYGTVYNRDYWKKCQQLLNELPPHVKAKYCGEAENSKINDLLQQYHFMFMPTLGENFGHVILESLSAACPVIISDRTPWQKLVEAKAGWTIPLDSKENFIRVIHQCMEMNQEEYALWSKGALEFAKKTVENKDTINANKRLFLSA